MRKKIYVFIVIINMVMFLTGGCAVNEIFPKEPLMSEPSESVVLVPMYERYYETSPHAAYSAEEWLTEDGHLDFPFDLHEDTGEMQMSEVFARFYVPDEALKNAATEELLNVVKLWPMTRYHFYNFPSNFFDYYFYCFNATGELLERPDLAMILLDTYKKDEFMPVCRFDDGEEQTAYDKECYSHENAIVLEEVLLARDEVFDKMDDEMRQQTLNATMEKMELRQSGEYPYLVSSSGFFAYVGELHNTTGSKWYNYITEILQDSELVEYLDEFWNHHYWPLLR